MADTGLERQALRHAQALLELLQIADDFNAQLDDGELLDVLRAICVIIDVLGL